MNGRRQAKIAFRQINKISVDIGYCVVLFAHTRIINRQNIASKINANNLIKRLHHVLVLDIVALSKRNALTMAQRS